MTSTSKEVNRTSATSPSSKGQEESSYPVRQSIIKKTWDTSYVPRGSVMDRIKVFSGDLNHRKDEEPELTNTGRTNPALKKRRELERQQELARQRALDERRKLAQSKYGLGTTRNQRNMAATAIQSVVRMKRAKTLAVRRREQVLARQKAKAERQRQTEAAIKIQAIMRSSVTRMRVCKMVEDMIANLMEQENAEERRIRDIEEEAVAIKDAAIRAKEEQRKAQQAEAERLILLARAKEEQAAAEAEAIAREKAAAELQRKQAEEERLALAALARAQQEAEAEELAREKAAAELKSKKAEEERLALAALSHDQREATAEEIAREHAAAELKSKQAEEERLALAALARDEREAQAEAIAQEKASAEAEAEALKLAILEEKKKKKEAEALERERRRKNMNLFVGPLPWGVGLLPDWWMDAVPHKTLQLDSITEEDNGEGFEEWRTSNVQSAIC